LSRICRRRRESFLQLAAENEIAPILIFAPTSTDERMRLLASHGKGLSTAWPDAG